MVATITQVANNIFNDLFKIVAKHCKFCHRDIVPTLSIDNWMGKIVGKITFPSGCARLFLIDRAISKMPRHLPEQRMGTDRGRLALRRSRSLISAGGQR
jgi:hypothetical protein